MTSWFPWPESGQHSLHKRRRHTASTPVRISTEGPGRKQQLQWAAHGEAQAWTSYQQLLQGTLFSLSFHIWVAWRVRCAASENSACLSKSIPIAVHSLSPRHTSTHSISLELFDALDSSSHSLATPLNPLPALLQPSFERGKAWEVLGVKNQGN